jgi:hypothetical protein
MGSLSRSVERVKVEKYGARRSHEQAVAVGRMWDEIRSAIDAWDLAWPGVRLYQDGLPVCGRETPIVEDLAQAGSANHQLLLSLVARGATLVGTESPDLLLEEYRLAKLIYAAADAATAARLDARYRAQSRSVLARRDRYIASRINDTLLAGETGLLFLGLLHRVESALATDILVRHPLSRPPQGNGR